MNIGAWRDLHRHRIQTQLREKFTVINGYDIPKELIEVGLDQEFSEAIKKMTLLFFKKA